MPIDAKTLLHFPNAVFVETGTYRGGGIRAALDAGYERIISIEAHPQLWKEGHAKYADLAQVTVIHGDSSRKLSKAIAGIDKPITFWLDAHGYGGDGSLRLDCPLPGELEAIRAHSLHSHTILIDDIHLLGHSYMRNVSEDSVIKTLLDINPNYLLMQICGPSGRWRILGAIP